MIRVNIMEKNVRKLRYENKSVENKTRLTALTNKDEYNTLIYASYPTFCNYKRISIKTKNFSKDLKIRTS